MNLKETAEEVERGILQYSFGNKIKYDCDEYHVFLIEKALEKAYNQGREEERKRCIEWIRSELRDCGCADRIEKAIEENEK